MPEMIASTYELTKKLGAGGGGTVYLANHLRLGKKVVLKADKRAVTTRPELLRREVDVLKNLSHPYIPQVYDYFVEDGTVYTVMDYIQGESLDKPLKRGEKYPQPQVIKWAKQLLGALSYLHSPTHGDPPRGYVHSDVKPANLMRTPDNDIYLIDFNIALALGEENVVGCSIGYASPEHYGLDFSSYYDTATSTSRGRSRVKESGSRMKKEAPDKTEILQPSNKTEVMENLGETELLEPIVEKERMPGSRLGAERKASPSSAGGSSFSGKVIIPDVRSDIYSVGATLYHLLSGKRPARNAMEVEPLSEEDFSPQIVAIISRAMNPNPDLRYQAADEMLDAFLHLHENDARMRHWKRNSRITAVLFSVSILFSVAVSFVGLKRMQTAQAQLTLAEYSANALKEGDVSRAIRLALEAVPDGKNLLEAAVRPQSQLALTEALGVYALGDGFQPLDTLELPAAPFGLVVSPGGTRFAVAYAYEAAVYDMESMEKMAVLPIQESAYSDCCFIGENQLAYAGPQGVSIYDLDRQEILWTGRPGTTLAISADGKRVAAVNRREDEITVYSTEDGGETFFVELSGRHMRMPANDIYANPNDDIFTLNGDGSILAVSFSDGGLALLDMGNPGNALTVYEKSEYSHFQGGFYGQYFAFAAGGDGESVFGLIDVLGDTEPLFFDSGNEFLLEAGERGIYLAEGNLLVKIEPVPGTEGGVAQRELARTDNVNITAFSVGEKYVLAAADDGSFSFYNSGANLSSRETTEGNRDFVAMVGDYAIVGSRNEPTLRLLRLESHPEAQLLSYDARYRHSEARVSGDGRTAMLFDYEGFRIYDMAGNLLAEEQLPDGAEIYDQQFGKKLADSLQPNDFSGQGNSLGEDGSLGEGNALEESSSWLEVTWYDGTRRYYSAADGSLLLEEKGEAPEKDLLEEFYTDQYRIVSGLHSAPEVYNRKSGRMVATLEPDSYLTYVTQVREYILTEYISTEDERYGILLDNKLGKIAILSGLCDVMGDMLVFDYGSGDLRYSKLYSLEELVGMGEDFLRKGGE